MLALLVLMLVAFPCLAQERTHDVRLGVGADVLHERGMAMASLSMDAFTLLAWHENFGAGVSYRLGSRDGWYGSLGGIAVRHTNQDLGTHLNFLLRAGYCGERLCLSFAHLSHGAQLGIQRDAANSGLNFLFLEYRLPE
jgi:hypothetical protein